MRQNKENGFKPHFRRFFLDSYHWAMRYRKGGTRQKNAHAARRNVCAIVRAVYVLCTFCFLPLVLLVLRNSLICSHACFTLTFCSFTFCFIPRSLEENASAFELKCTCVFGNALLGVLRGESKWRLLRTFVAGMR